MTIEQLKNFITDRSVNDLPEAAVNFDESETFPEELVVEFCQKGFLRLPFPKEVGGLGGSYDDFLRCIQIISASFAALGSILFTQSAFGIWPIYAFGTEAQKELYLEKMLAGKYGGSFAFSEPDIGSQLDEISTVATRHAEGWQLSGFKQMVSNAPVSDLYYVVARVKEENKKDQFGVFLVPRETKGVTVGPTIEKVGVRPLPVSSITFENTVIPEEAILGGRLEASKQVENILNRVRLAIAAQSVGVAQGALSLGIDYVTQERKFGLHLINSIDIQNTLAEVKTEIDAAEVFLEHVIKTGSTNTIEISKAKLLCTNISTRTTESLMQMTGGYGYIRNNNIERYARDAKITALYGGSPQTQKKIIIQPWLPRKK